MSFILFIPCTLSEPHGQPEHRELTRCPSQTHFSTLPRFDGRLQPFNTEIDSHVFQSYSRFSEARSRSSFSDSSYLHRRRCPTFVYVSQTQGGKPSNSQLRRAGRSCQSLTIRSYQAAKGHSIRVSVRIGSSVSPEDTSSSSRNVKSRVITLYNSVLPDYFADLNQTIIGFTS